MKAATEKLKKMDWPSGVTSAQQASRVVYQGNGFERINGALRETNRRKRTSRMGSGMGDQTIKERVADLDGFIGHAHPLPDDLVLYRGVKTEGLKELEAFRKAQAGDVLSDKAFGSWSGKRSIALEFGEQEGVVFRMQARAGEKVAYFGTVEEEFLLARNTSYRVVSVEEGVTTLKTTKRARELKHTVVTVERFVE